MSCGDVVDIGTSSWCGSTGLVSQTQRGGRSVGKGSGGSGMTRGDRRRNARRERLRKLLPRDGAVIGIDLAQEKQALAVIDHDVRVAARGPGPGCGRRAARGGSQRSGVRPCRKTDTWCPPPCGLRDRLAHAASRPSLSVPSARLGSSRSQRCAEIWRRLTALLLMYRWPRVLTALAVRVAVVRNRSNRTNVLGRSLLNPHRTM